MFLFLRWVATVAGVSGTSVVLLYGPWKAPVLAASTVVNGDWMSEPVSDPEELEKVSKILQTSIN